MASSYLNVWQLPYIVCSTQTLLKLYKADSSSLVISQNEETKLLRENKKEYAEIIKWMSIFNTEIVILMTQILLPQIGIIP